MPLYKLSDDKIIEWARTVVAAVDKNTVQDKKTVQDKNKTNEPIRFGIGLKNAFVDLEGYTWVRVPKNEKAEFMDTWQEFSYSEEYLKEIFRSKL